MFSWSDGACTSCGMNASLMPGSCGRLGADVLSHSVGLVQVVAGHLNVDRRGDALVEHRVDKAARLKVDAEFGGLPLERSAHAIHVLVASYPVSLGKAYLNIGGVGAELLV